MRLVVVSDISQARLKRVNLVYGSARHKADLLAPLGKLLGMSKLEWERSFLNWRTGGKYSIYWNPTLCVCLKCLELAYHTVAFQPEGKSVCPIHDCELVRTCPDCGELLSSDFDSRFLEFPFRCFSCRKEFATRSAILDPPQILDASKIARFSDWFGDE
jgi:hypothetical protein